MCKQITIYSVPGPNFSPGLLREQIEGGWAYALENLEFLTELNPDCHLNVVFGHVKEFGLMPSISHHPRVKLHVYETSLTELSSSISLEPAEQHGAILNFILSTHVLQTQFYLILDPDCYVIKKNALHELINHMDKFELDMIGVSYPTTFPKVYYWDFPTAYFQLVNRMNCEPYTLNFSPERTALVAVAGTGLATSVSAPFARTFGLIAKLVKFSKIPLKKFLNRLQNSKHFFVQFIFYFYTNFVYRNTSLFRDTGWKNRSRHSALNSEVIPHRISPTKVSAGLNVSEYISNNVDVRESGIDPTWHALMHGIYEKREFGRQNMFWLLFHKLLKGDSLHSETFPATSLIMGKSFLDAMKMSNGEGNFRYSFEYFWRHELFCIHLGHGGKDSALKDIFRLKEIKSQIMESDGNWSNDD
jgi:hypothetical protein